MPVQAGAAAVEPGAVSGDGPVGARCSSGEDVDGLEEVGVEGGEVMVDGNAGPVSGEYLPAVRVGFAEPGDAVSGVMESEVEESRAGAE
jgi:hypothetical protein